MILIGIYSCENIFQATYIISNVSEWDIDARASVKEFDTS